MKNFKRFFVICLMVVLTLTMVSCKKNPDKKPDPKPSVTPTVTLDKTNVELTVGDTYTVNPTVKDATDNTVELKSSDATVASVNGLVVTAVKEGNATITVTLKENTAVTATLTVKVNRKLNPSISLSGDDKVNIGETITLLANLTDLEGTVEWSTSDANVATVEAGVVTGVGEGEVTITAKVGNFTITKNVTVEDPIERSLTITSNYTSVQETKKITLVAHKNNITGTVRWTSSDESIAKVSSTGTVTGVSVGKVTITATCGEYTATFEVEVTGMPRIELTAEKTTVLFGNTLQINAELKFVEGTITWTSNKPSVATVDANGLVTPAGGEGVVTITATCGTVKATIEINVELPTFTVTFKDGDTVLKETEIKYGNAATAPEAPSKEGYMFVGWDKEFSNITEDTTVNAVYKKMYNLTYELNGGAFLDTSYAKTFYEGQTITLPTAVFKSGYQLVGWALTAEGEAVSELVGEAKDITLYAVWKEKIITGLVNVGPTEDCKTIAAALDIVLEGGTIKVAAGTYNENVLITKKVTIIGPNEEANGNGTRAEEAVINGTITIDKGVGSVTILGMKVNGTPSIKLAGSNDNVTIKCCVLTSAYTSAGSGTTPASNIHIVSANNFVANENKFEVTGGQNYTESIYAAKLGSAEINNNYFTCDCSTTVGNVFAINLEEISGYFLISNNMFYRYAGDFWTTYMGSAGVAKGTIIDYLDNMHKGETGDGLMCGICFRGCADPSIYVNVIGNTFENVKDGVVFFRGAANSNSAPGSKAHINCMYNKFMNQSARVLVGIDLDYVNFTKNYTYEAFNTQSNSLNPDCTTFAKDNFATAAALDADYAVYKTTHKSEFVEMVYETNGGTCTGAPKFIAGTTFTLPTPKKENYKFLGWTLTAEDTDYVTEVTGSAGETITVYAHWELVVSFNVKFNFNGGYSEDLLIANKGDAKTLPINSYNYSNGTFWGGRYTSDIFIGEATCDPTATFSDRFYIAKNKENGLYEVVSALKSGGSVWPVGAEYVITISNSYNSYYGTINPITRDIEAGWYVAFDGDFTKATADNIVDVYFFPEIPEMKVTSVTKKITSDSTLVVPGNLGYKFLGWFDLDGKLYSSIDDLTGDVELFARWEELNPVTGITITECPEEMTKGDTVQIKGHVDPDDAYFQKLYFESSNTDILQVDGEGNVTAVNAGTATITIHDYLSKVTITKEITVYPEKTIDITYTPKYDGALTVDQEIEIVAKMFGKGTEGTTFTYASKNEAVATVDANGKITAVSKGYAEIVVTASTGENISLGITVYKNESEDTVDKVMELLVANHFSVIETGNLSLYNDGRKKVFVPVYGSVNRYLFDEFKVDETYYATSENNPNNHKSRTAVGNGKIEFVTVHDTATLTGTVVSIASGMSSGETSIHYTVGNDAIYGVVPEKYIAYHAGDGTGSTFKWNKTNVKATAKVAPEFGVTTGSSSSGYVLTLNGEATTVEVPLFNGKAPTKENFTHLGPTWDVVDGYYYIGGPLWYSSDYGVIGSKGGNNNSIGIEMCSNTSGDMYDTWQRTAQLVADICLRNGFDTTRVKQHNTWTGKNCPQDIIEGGYWWDFMKMVDLQYAIQKDYKDVKITMKSNNPDIVDETGRVYNAPKKTTTVSYDLTVSYGSTTKTMTLYSVVPGTTTWEQWDGTYPASTVWNDKKFLRY